MRRAVPSLILGLLLACAWCPLAAQSGVFLDGRWEGSIDLGEGPEAFVLRLFPADPETGAATGGLVDLPARKLFGYPLEKIERDTEGLSFSFLDGAPFDGIFELKGSPVSVDSGESFAASGTIMRLGTDAPSGAPSGGRFFLAYSGIDSRGPDYGAEYLVDSGRGILPGSLLFPTPSRVWPCRSHFSSRPRAPTGTATILPFPAGATRWPNSPSHFATEVSRRCVSTGAAAARHIGSWRGKRTCVSTTMSRTRARRSPGLRRIPGFPAW